MQMTKIKKIVNKKNGLRLFLPENFRVLPIILKIVCSNT